MAVSMRRHRVPAGDCSPDPDSTQAAYARCSMYVKVQKPSPTNTSPVNCPREGKLHKGVAGDQGLS